MVAIVGGNGLGLLNSSAGVLGGQGVFGKAAQGGNKEAAYLNIVNGNLTLQDSDDYLAAHGINVALTRTYNSQGSVNEGNGVAWKYGMGRSVTGATGVVNTAGSTVMRTAGDGSTALYTYDTTKAAYVTTDGDGAYQSLVFNTTTGQWIWRADRFDLLGVYETYDMINGGRLFSVNDQTGVRQKFYYNASGRLSQITDATGSGGVAGDQVNNLNDQITFEYDANGNLADINTRLAGTTTSAGANTSNLIRVRYTYDGLNRLASTIIDLSTVRYDSAGKPLLSDDNLSISDGNTYVTTYTYDGDSSRIASVGQSDGTRVSFTYKPLGADWKVDSYTDANGKTTLDYTVPGKTTVTDPLGLQTVYGFDAKGQLTDVTRPAVAGTPAQVTRFFYDAKGNLAHVTDPRGLDTAYTYDANGNRILERDFAGNTIARNYNLSNNLLLGEARYVTPDPDGAGAAAASVPLSTRYLYSAANRLHYVFSPEGRVTEYRYTPQGEIASELHYESGLYNMAGWPVLAAGVTEAAVDTALAGAGFDKTKVSRTDYAYDAHGLRTSATRYASTDATGAGINDGLQSTTRYVYDQAGNLLSTYDGQNNATNLVYDGLGRVLSSTDAAGNSVLSVYDDSHNTQLVYTRAASGATTSLTTYVRDAAGQLTSVRKEAVGAQSGSTSYVYDAGGRLRATTNADGQKTYLLYDDAGRKVAQIEHNGALTEFIYNADNQITRTIAYTSKVSTADLLDAQGQPRNVTLKSLRDTISTVGRSTYNGYDNAGRLVASVDENGYLTRMVYDGASRLVQTIYRALPVDITKLDGQTIAASFAGEASPDDRISRVFYTDDGLLAGKLDALGYLTEYKYNAAGLLIDTIAYFTITGAALRPAGTLAALRPGPLPADIHQRNFYNGAHQLLATIDGDNFLTEISYDAAGNVSSRRRYALAVTAPTALTLDKIGKAISADDRITTYSYNALNQLDRQTDPAGTYTQYTYDNNGKVVNVTRGSGSTAERSSTVRYDGNGRLVAELSAEGASRLAALPAPLDGNAVAQIWALYATHYVYDATGLRTSMSDAQGTRTLYFYDDNGRLTQTVNGAGEVTEQRYNTFNQVVKTIQYGKRIDTAVLATLTGGANDAAFKALALTGGTDLANTLYYDDGGRLRYSVDGTGQVQERTYNAFDQVVQSISYASKLDGAVLPLLTGDAIKDNLAAYRGSDFQRTLFYYDQAGQLTYSINPLGEVQGKTYTPFGKVLAATQYGLRAANLAKLTGASTEIAAFALANAANSVQTYSYNLRGALLDLNINGNHTLNSYDGFGALIKTAQLATANSTVAAPALDQITQTVYDANGRVAATIDPTGTVTAYQYDSDGHVIDQVRYANALAGYATSTNIAKTYSDAIAAKLLSDPARDQHQRFIYDGDGKLVATLTAQLTTKDAQNNYAAKWAVLRQTRDLDGRVLGTTAYTQRMDSATLAPASADVLAWIATADARTVNDPALVNGQPVDAGPVNDAQVRYVYDGAGRVLVTATAQRRDGSNTLQWSLTRQWYDTRGNVTQRTTFATWLTANAPSVNELLTVTSAPSDAITAFEYDAANRVVATAVAQGPSGPNDVPPSTQYWAMTTLAYDGYGNVSSKTQHATILRTNSLPARLSTAVTANAQADRVTRYRYDMLNRPVVTIDASGAVTRMVYDTRGNAVQSIAYADLTTTPDAITATYNPALKPTDRVTTTVYDLQHQPVYQIDALGQVTERTYDTLGNLTSVIRYATALAPAKLSAVAAAGADALPAAIKTAMGLAAPVLTLDRVERYAYDQDGQLRYTVDAAGYLKETIYNALGQVAETRDYLQLPPTALPLAPTAAQLLAEASRQFNAGYAAVNKFSYDVQGNRISATDALNFTETYQYDGLRNKISYTNKAGSTWTYRYDAAGHMVQETSPQVAAYSNGIGMAMGAWGAGTPTALVTRFEYDALGNLAKRTEAAGTDKQRETRYVYDAVGRQTQTILQSAKVYNDTDPNSNSSAAGRTELDSGERITTVSYNAFGNAVANRDVGGSVSYKVYDLRGQVAYDVDALGYVTFYDHDTFGNVTTLTRYAKAATPLGNGLTPASLNAKQYAGQIVLDGANDRTIRTDYDLLGRVIKVSEPVVAVFDQRATGASPYLFAGKTTETDYNTFGDTIATSVYGADSKGARVTDGAESRYYFDARGNKTAEISALTMLPGGHTGTGYLTTYIYGFDLASKTSTVRKTEYNNSYDWNDALPNGGTLPTPAAGLDRVTQTVSDKRGQQISSTNVQVSVFENGKQITRDVTTSYTYDAVGNQTSVTDALGGTVYTYFDKLGRTVGVAKVQTVAYFDAPNSGTPMSEFKLDILGNVILRVDYARNPPTTPTVAGATPLDVTDPNNRVTATRYDRDGRAIEVQDAEQFVKGSQGSLVNTSYDVYGRVAKQWRSVTANYNGAAPVVQTAFQINRYNALGQVVEVLTPGQIDLIKGTSGGVVHKSSQYNAFGEVYATGYATSTGGVTPGSVQQVNYTRYDQAGRAWLSNAGDGVDRATLYDAMGHATAQVVSNGSDIHVLQGLGGAQQVKDQAQVLRTETRYDMLGHVVDNRQVNDPRLTVLTRVNGAWVRTQLDGSSAVGGNLIVIGDALDSANTLTVKYRLAGSTAWTDASAQRVQRLDDNVAFSTAGLPGGSYEFVVSVTVKGESAFDRLTGSWTVDTQNSPQSAQLLGQAYLAMLHRGADLVGLNFYVDRLNKGESLAHLVNGLLYSTEGAVYQYASGSSTDVINTFLRGLGRGGNGDANFAADLTVWAQRYDDARKQGGDAPAQLLLDIIDTVSSYSGQDAGMQAAKNQLANQLKATLAYAQTYLGTSAETAKKVADKAALDLDGALILARDGATVENRSIQITQLYLALFGRAPEKDGLGAWIDAMAKGLTLEQVANGMLLSAEAKDPLLYPDQGTTSAYQLQLVRTVYQTLLGRAATTAEETDALAQLNGKPGVAAISNGQWVIQLATQTANYNGADATRLADKLSFNNRVTVGLSFATRDLSAVPMSSRAAVSKALMNSIGSAASAQAAADAAVAANATTITVNNALASLAGTAAGATLLENMRLQLSRLYVVLLNRTLDTVGMNYLLQQLTAEGPGMPSSGRWASLATSLMASTESQGDPTLFGGALTDTQFVERLYTMALGKLPTSAAARSEIAGYVAQLASQSRGQVAVNVLNGMLSYGNLNPDDTALMRTFDNKVAVSLACAVDLGAYGWGGGGAIQTSRDVLSKVTATDTKVALDYAYLKSQDSVRAANASLAASSANTVAALNAAKAAATAASQAATAAQTAATAANAAAGANDRLQLLALYVGVLGRDENYYRNNPDLVGLDFQAEKLAGSNLNTVALGFINSPDGQALYPNDTMDNQAFVSSLYTRVLGSATLGQDFYASWVAKLNPPGAMTRGDVALGIVNEVLNYGNYTPDQNAVAYLRSRQTLMSRLSGVAALVDTAQAAAVAAATGALAGKTQPPGTVDSLKAAVTSTAKAQADAIDAITAALNIANAAGDGSATMRLQMTRLYASLLQYKTAPTLDEMNGKLNSGLPLEAIAQQMINANPALFPANNDQFIVTLYKNILGRDMDGGDDITLWTRVLINNAGDPNVRGRVAVSILNAYLQYTDSSTAQITAHAAFDTKVSGFLVTEKAAVDKANTDAASALTTANGAVTTATTNLGNASKAVTAAQNAANDPALALNAGYGTSFLQLTSVQSQVVSVYLGLRGTGDVPGMSVQMRALAAGGITINNLINDLLVADKYPADSTQFVQKLYTMVLGRAAKPEESSFWANFITTGQFSRVEVASRIINAGEAQTRLADMVTKRLPDFIGIAQGYLDKRDAANANVLTAQQNERQAGDDLQAAKYRASLADGQSKAAAKAAQSAAALATAYAKIPLATTAALNAAKARDAYNLGVQFAALNKTKAYGVADHAAAVLAAANATLASAQTDVANRYAIDRSAPSIEREVNAVARIYQAALNRAPLLTELNYWTAKLSADVTPAELGNMAASLLATTEGQTAYPSTLTNDAFVTKLYLFGLNRGFAGDPKGLALWSGLLAGATPLSRPQLIAKWVNDVTLAGTTDAATFAGRVATSLQLTVNEAQSAPNLLPAIQLTDIDARNAATAYDASAAAALAASPQAQNVKALTRLYIAVLNRVPDAAGLNSWLDSIAKGSTLLQIANGLVTSAEGLRLYPATMVPRDFVKQMLSNVYGRTPTDAEITPYVTAMTGKTRGDAALSAITAIADGSGGDLLQMSTRVSFNSRVAGALDRLGAEASSNAAMAQTVRPLLLSIQSSGLIERHVDTVLDGTVTVAKSGAQQVLSANRLGVDRWGNTLSITDARNSNWKTIYTYNYNNQQIDQTLNALVGDTKAAHAVTAYDALGRTVLSVDYNGNATRLAYDSNGNLRMEAHPDTGQVVYDYDLFGGRTSVFQPNTMNGSVVAQYGVTTRYTYDHLGHKTSVTIASNQAGRKVDVYSATYYDVDGNDTPFYSTVDSLTTSYAYDELGRNISITSADGAVSRTAYDLDGNVVMSIASYKPQTQQFPTFFGIKLSREEPQNITLNTYDAFHHLTGTKDANGNTMSWITDVFGRVTKHTDLGGAEIVTDYNAAGQKISQVTARYTGLYVESIRINYGYKGTLLTSIDQSSTVIDTLDADHHVVDHLIGTDSMLTSYEYDLVGNRVRERQTYAPDNTKAPARAQNNTLRYDMQNRVVSIKDDQYTLSYTYDANGNRLSVNTVSGGKDLGTVYNTFDVMNRQKIVNGDSSDGGKTVVLGAHGHALTYDLSGNRLSDTFIGLKLTYVDGYYYATGGGQQTTETYNYDALGRLATTQRDGITIDQRHYDAASRVTESGFLDYVKQSGKNQYVTKSLQTMATALGIETGSTTYHYDNSGRIQRQTIRGTGGDISTDYYYVDDQRMRDRGYIGGYDAVGNLLGYTIVTPDRKWEDYGRYSISYSRFDNYKEASNQVFGGDKSVSTYDVTGNRTSVTIGSKLVGKYWYDAAGHVQSKIAYGDPGKTVDPKPSFSLIVNDQVLGYEDGDATNILGSSYMSAHSNAMMAAPSAYTVQSADETLQSIAQAAWGDSKLWYLIADANGLNAGDKLTVGRVLNIPTRVNTVHNDYGTVKPYDAAEAIGNTTPAIPPPSASHGGGCGGAGKLLMAVVAIAVTVYTGGLMAGFASQGLGAAMLAGAAAGAAGAVASQLVGMAIGEQDGFNWKGVGMAALGGAVTAGVGSWGEAAGDTSWLNGKEWTAVASRAALSNTITQGVSNLTGLQHGFNWTSVAASYAGAAVGNEVGGYLKDKEVFSSFMSNTSANIANATVSGFSAGLTTAVMRGGKIAVAQIATDAFGNALGSSLAEQMRPMSSGSSSTGSSGSGSGQGGSAANESNGSGDAPSNGGGGAEILPDGSVRGSDGKIRRPGVRAIDLGPGAAGGAGFMDIAQGASGGDANGKAYAFGNSGFAFYGLRSDTNFPVTAKPAFLKDVNLTYSFDSAGTAFWLDRSNGTLLSPNAPYAMPSKADMEFDAFLSGAGDNLAGLAKGAWDFTKTGVGMFFGDQDSWKRSIVATNQMSDQLLQQTPGSLLRAAGDGVISASPVGVVRSFADGNPYEAGGRFSTFATGQAGGVAFRSLGNLALGSEGYGELTLRTVGTDKIVMRSPSELMGVEPASAELLAAVGGKRTLEIAQPGSEALRMLDYFGAEASVGGELNSSILLRQNPSKAAVLEEFLHGTQARLGIVDRLGTSGLGSAETHVKDFMMRHQSMLGLSAEDVRILKILRDKGL